MSKKWFLIFVVLLLASVYLFNSQKEAEIVVYVDDVGEYDISELQAVLSRHNIRATYSVVPTRLTSDVASQLSGEKVCIHGYDHEFAEFITDYYSVTEKLLLGAQKLESSDLYPTCFRPPWDLISPEAEDAVRDSGLDLVGSKRDYFFQNPLPEQTAYLLRVKLLLTKKLVFTVHMPVDERTLKTLDKLLSNG